MPISDKALLAILEQNREDSVGEWLTDIAGEQDYLLRRYLGLPYGDEQEGRSQVVSTDIAQVVDWAIPDLIEPFVASDQAMQFEPVGEEDIERAEQATDYVNMVYWQKNPGFRVTYDVIKDGLVQKVGIAKVRAEVKEKTVEHTQTGLSGGALALLRADPDIEITSTESEPVANFALRAAVEPGLQEAFPDGVSHVVTYNRTIEDVKIRVESVPPEQFRITERATSVHTAPYTAHEQIDTPKSALLEMGFAEQDVMDAHDTGDRGATDTRRDTRFVGEQRRANQSGSDIGRSEDWTRETVTLLEEYLRIDWDGDGDEELMQIFRVGSTIFEKREVPCDPWGAFCPYPIPHRFFGESLADKTLQTQRTKTVLTRQMLDNVYLANNPQREVADDAVTEDGSTYDDLLTFRVGGIVRTKKFGNIREMGVEDRSGTALQAIQHLDAVREAETGVVRGQIGLASESVDKDLTAREFAGIERGSSKRLRMMQRLIAEEFFAPFWQKILRVVTEHQQREETVRLRGKWVAIDPRSWNADMDVISNVGLGYPNRESQLAGAQLVKQAQTEAAQIGMAGPEQFYNTAEQLVQGAGLRFTDRYFIDPATPEFQAAQEAQPEEPDPAMIAIQQKAQIDQARLEQDGQLKAAKLQQDAQLAQMKLAQEGQIDMAKAQMQAEVDILKAQIDAAGDDAKARQDFETSLAKVQADFETKLAKINRETALALEKQDRETMLAIRGQNIEAELKAFETVTNGSGAFRPGGRLDE